MDAVFPLLSALILQLLLKLHPLFIFALSLLPATLIFHSFIVFLQLEKGKGVLELVSLVLLVVITFVVEDIFVLPGFDEVVDLFTLQSILVNKFLPS